ncbi:MAG: glycosyltransferase family 4 protein [Pirellulales bacterium]|nr:glycosyltransferase family 4 protein [Pirellulales bacterium]
MRILLVNDSPLVGSGSGTTTEELGRALLRAGHDVRGLLLADRRDIAAPFPVRAVVCSTSAPAAELPFDFPVWTWHPASRATYAMLAEAEFHRLREVLRIELDREVSDFDPEVIHCQHLGLWAHLALESGVPYVVSAHAASLQVACEDARLQLLAEQAAENAAALIASSEDLSAEIRRRLPGVETRLELVRPAWDRAAIARSPQPGEAHLRGELGLPSGESPLVVFAGTLVPRHGATTLINAAAICESMHPTLRLLIVGDGPQREELHLQAGRLSLERTHFLGWQPRAAVQHLLGEAALAVVPSHGAPSTWAMLEAQGAGAPIVASAGDGREELLSLAARELVPPDDHELLADAILRGIAEGWKKKPSAMVTAQELDPARWARENIAIYERARRERGPRV